MKNEPNLIVMGAQKSGTSSLHSALAVHPDVFMSCPVKEPEFFAPMRRIRTQLRRHGVRVLTRGQLLRRHMLAGYGGQSVIGESSTLYTFADLSAKLKLPERIYSRRPDMAFIYVVRNPFERIVSHYLHNRRMGYTTASFADAVEGQWAMYVGTSCYHMQLARYLKLFDASQFLLLRFEDLLSDSAGSLSQCYRFLGVGAGNRAAGELPCLNRSANRESFSAEELQLPLSLLDRVKSKIDRDLDALHNVFPAVTLDWTLPEPADVSAAEERA